MSIQPLTLQFEDYPDKSLTILVFKDVTNSSELRAQIMASTLEPEMSIINAQLVPHPLIIQAAAYKTLTAQHRNALKTKTLHSELVFNLSGTKHIGESLTRFGIQDNSTQLLIGRFDATEDDIIRMKTAIQGTECSVEDLQLFTDMPTLKKYYKLVDPELVVGTLEGAIVSRVAARDCT